MPRRPTKRIRVTMPAETLRRAERLARELDRSRSWVFAEGVRRLPEPAATAPRARLDESRLAQLKADMQLTVTERVLAAERTAREAPQRRRIRVFVSFERQEDYFEWKRCEGILFRDGG